MAALGRPLQNDTFGKCYNGQCRQVTLLLSDLQLIKTGFTLQAHNYSIIQLGYHNPKAAAYVAVDLQYWSLITIAITIYLH